MTERANITKYGMITRKALALCGVALPLVVFNLFASRQQSDMVNDLSLAMTLIFIVIAVWFVVAATTSLAQRTDRTFHA